MTKPLEDWLTVPEVAALKGVTQNSVRVAMQTDRLVWVKKGRGYLIRRASAEAWQVSNRGPKRGQRE